MHVETSLSPKAVTSFSLFCRYWTWIEQRRKKYRHERTDRKSDNAIAQQVVAQLGRQKIHSRKFSPKASYVSGKPAHIRKCFLKVSSQAIEDFGSPTGFLLAGEDDLSGLLILREANRP